ncbi:DMT family transporter [Virgibacillus alimentarius]|uniref:DMT family transporter n=1 Tax=Virgibacillus alimentarius TaxID=698769 RepID=UPI000ABA6FE2|nr:DMT family transporter [Virgibacillus alimentarius]
MYPYIFMIFVVLFYAGNILVGKAMNDLPPLTIAFFRLLIAFIIMIPFGIREAWTYRSTFLTYKKPFLLMTLTGITLFNTFIYGALSFTTATKVSVLESSIPVATVILSVILLKDKLYFVHWIGILLSFFGSLWVIMNGQVFHLTSIDWNVGDGIMIGAVIAWAIYSIMVKKYMHLFPHYGVLLMMTGISVIILLPVVLLEWFIAGLPFLTIAKIMGLVYLGVFPSFIALLFYNRAVDLLSPSRASVFLNFLPIVTMTGAFLWLDEEITIMHLIGTLAVIIGVLLTTQVKVQKNKIDRQIENG